MSQFGPGQRKFADGEFVRTPKGAAGRVVRAYVEQEPQHDDAFWDHELNCWWTDGDEYMQHVYHVETADGVWPWPEELLETATVLDMLV